MFKSLSCHIEIKQFTKQLPSPNKLLELHPSTQGKQRNKSNKVLSSRQYKLIDHNISTYLGNSQTFSSLNHVLAVLHQISIVSSIYRLVQSTGRCSCFCSLNNIFSEIEDVHLFFYFSPTSAIIK